MRFKFIGLGRGNKGYTIIELLIVAAIIGILLAIAIPNLIKARLSANEANARKAMQTLRDAEGEFFEQDADDNGERDFTSLIGDLGLTTDRSLRCPNTGAIVPCDESDALVDNSFVGSLPGADGADATDAVCSTAGGLDPKAGYCIGWSADADFSGAVSTRGAVSPILTSDFGWEASPTVPTKTGRRDFGVWGDGVIRCTTSSFGPPDVGMFEASRDGTSGGLSSACD